MGEITHDDADGCSSSPQRGGIDRAALGQLHAIDGTGETLRAIVGLYLRNAPLLVERITAAAAAADAESARIAAHSLLGSSQTVGAVACGDAAHEMEQSLRDGRFPSEEAVEALRGVVEETAGALQFVVDERL